MPLILVGQQNAPQTDAPPATDANAQTNPSGQAESANDGAAPAKVKTEKERML